MNFDFSESKTMSVITKFSWRLCLSHGKHFIGKGIGKVLKLQLIF